MLTVGLTTYSSDERFSVIHLEKTEVKQLGMAIMRILCCATHESIN